MRYQIPFSMKVRTATTGLFTTRREIASTGQPALRLLNRVLTNRHSRACRLESIELKQLAVGQLQIVVNHDPHKLLEVGLWSPAKLFPSFRGVPQQ